MKTNSEIEELTKEIKESVLKAGADLAGVVSAADIDAYPRHLIGWEIQKYTKKTTETMSNSKSVIVIGFHVWDDILEAVIRKEDKWVYPGYLPLSTQTNETISLLKAKGYDAAYPRLVSLKRLAQLAGFGAFGKNALIINPRFGPWIRLSAIVTNAELLSDKPFEQDLCGDCNNCVKACPVGALTPYKVDDTQCLVGIHISEKEISKYREALRRYEPNLTKHTHLMCMQCQKVCEYGKAEH